MKKLFISLKLFVSCKSTINLTSLRFNNSNVLDISSVMIGLELVFVNLCSKISENLLFVSFKENPDGFFFISRLDFSLTLELSELSSLTGLSVLE